MSTRRGRSNNHDDDDGAQKLLEDNGDNDGMGQPVPVDNIRVEAPYDLPAGYELETIVEGRPHLVTIPRGGVRAGQLFKPSSACLLSDISLSRLGGSRVRLDGDSGGERRNQAASSIPVGAWKDSQWDCFSLGCCHPTCCNSLVCPLLAAGQVITRLQLTWCGTPANSVSEVAMAFQMLVMIIIGVFCCRIFLFLIVAYLDPNTDPERTEFIEPSGMYFFFAAMDDLVTCTYFVTVVVVIRNIRNHMRRRYAIPNGDCCPGCEDLCCSMVCPCLVVSQMMRHTANYEEQRAICCNNTGLQDYKYEGSTSGSAGEASIV